MDTVTGLHHITAIAGDPRENLEFYRDLLGMRLVKKSVNQDDPGTYHLFYADGDGRPGTDLTFFPWTQMAPTRKGVGLTDEVLLAVPAGSLSYWQARLSEHGAELGSTVTRFGEPTLTLRDPHGMDLGLVEIADARPFTPWKSGPVPAERQIRGLHGARVFERDRSVSERFLTGVMGFEVIADEGGWRRYGLPAGDGPPGGSGRIIDVKELPQGRRGQWGTGGVHHLAWTVRDDEHQREVRERVAEAGRRPSETIDRFWFRSVYFMEPGGVLFELATEGPGFAVDEDPAHLGEQLILPPWLESHRSQIEAALPELDTEPRAGPEIEEATR